MPSFDDEQDGVWATRFGMTPDDRRQAPSAPPMTISDNGMGLIGRGEGYRPQAYVGQDRQNRTIGWGHVLRPGETYPNGIDMETAEALRRQDIAGAEAIVRHHVKVPLNQNQYDALVSLAYNAGARPFLPGHDMGDALRRGDFAAAAQAFALYHRPHGSTSGSNGLDNRRAAEAELFRRPIDH